MQPQPAWLPKQLVFSGSSIERDYTMLYEVFREDLLLGTLSIDGCNVVVDTSMEPTKPEYERGFMHMVTRSDDNGFRGIDYERAAKLPWVKAIIEHFNEPEVYSFYYQHPTDLALYLWLYDYDFVVVLKQMRSAAYSDKIIVTSYHVEPYAKRGLQSKFGRATRVI